MKHRRFFTTLAAATAVPAAVAQLPQGQPASGIPINPAQPVQPPVGTSTESSKIETTVPDAVAEYSPRFFTAQQFAALRRVSDILMPATNGAPGALAAQAPEFLDFLIGESPADRQRVYRAGLDALNGGARRIELPSPR